MSKLFEAFDLHGLKLNNRIVMAPLTRSRASADAIPSELAITYYEQRVTAGLIITEATAVSQQGRGYPNIPGAWNDTQVDAWKKIPNAVHAKGGKIFMQLFHTGRIGHSSLFGEQPVSASTETAPGKVMAADYSMQPYETPRSLGADEIPGIVEQFRIAARNAKQAGFDGVELHSANGYLLDQFLRDGTNKRTDKWGGSVENRARLLVEVVQAAIGEFGKRRVGIRFSPYNPFNGMSDSDPLKTYSRVGEMLNEFELAYLHIIEPLTEHPYTTDCNAPKVTDALRKIFKGPLILNGGLNQKSAEGVLKCGTVDLVCFGSLYISNPDLVERFKQGVPLASPDETTFYTGGAKGYIDYPRAT